MGDEFPFSFLFQHKRMYGHKNSIRNVRRGDDDENIIQVGCAKNISCVLLMDPTELPVFLSDLLPSAKEGYRFAEGPVHTDLKQVVLLIQFAIPENDPHSA